MEHTLTIGGKKIKLSEEKYAFVGTIASLATYESSTSIADSNIFYNSNDLVHDILNAIFEFKLDDYIEHYKLILKIFDFFMIEKELIMPNERLYLLIFNNEPDYFPKIEKFTIINKNNKETALTYIHTKNFFFIMKNNKFILKSFSNILFGTADDLEIKSTDNLCENKFEFDFDYPNHGQPNEGLIVITIKKTGETFCFNYNGSPVNIVKNVNQKTFLYYGDIKIIKKKNNFVFSSSRFQKTMTYRGTFLCYRKNIIFYIGDNEIVAINPFVDIFFAIAPFIEYRTDHSYTKMHIQKYNTYYYMLSNGTCICNNRFYATPNKMIDDIEKYNNEKIYVNINYTNNIA